MARSNRKADERNSSSKATGEEFYTRLFSLVMFGVCAAILLIVILGDW
jgi:hypothetical protein